MKAIVCEMCGSQEFAKQDGMYVCQHCGTKYDPEEAKKLMIEVSGSVEIDNSKKLEKLYILARRAKDEDNAEDAANYYSQIAAEEPDSWEAQFYKVLFTCKQTKIAYMGDSCIKLGNSLSNVFSLIDSSVSNITERESYKRRVINECVNYANLIASNIPSHGKSYSDPVNGLKFMQKHQTGVYILFFRIGSACKSAGFTEEAKDCFKISLSYAEMADADANEISAIQQQLASVDPTYQIPQIKTQSSSSGGCYVATAVYGSYNCPQVWTLRRYRDYTLAQTWYGRAFISTYYAVSPTLVKWFGHKDWFRNMWKPTLDRMVRKLNNSGVENTPYNDRKW